MNRRTFFNSIGLLPIAVCSTNAAPPKSKVPQVGDYKLDLLTGRYTEVVYVSKGNSVFGMSRDLNDRLFSKEVQVFAKDSVSPLKQFHCEGHKFEASGWWKVDNFLESHK